MNKEDWNNLNNMHRELTQNHLAYYDTAYLEKYAELLAQSLQGKGDSNYDDRN
jgi:hypothetical protein